MEKEKERKMTRKKEKTMTKKEFLLSRDEVHTLMKILGAKVLLGVQEAELKETSQSDATQEKAMDSLLKKGIVTGTGKSRSLNPEYTPIFSTLFHPEDALVVYRHISGVGDQILYFLSKENAVIMHSFPKELEHRIESFPDLNAVVEFLLEWFPMHKYPGATTNFQISQNSFEKIMGLVKKGQSKEAFKELDGISLPGPEKDNLIAAISSITINGTLTWININDQRVTDTQIVILFADKKTGWEVTHAKDTPGDNPMLLVRRAGPSTRRLVHSMASHLFPDSAVANESEKVLPFTRFPLSLDELALALIRIGSREMGSQMLAAAYPDLPPEQLEQRLEAAQTTMISRKMFAPSPKGNPIPIPQLEQAVLPIARARSMIQASAVRVGDASETSVYIIKDRSFTAYSRLDNEVQVLEHGQYNDLPFFIQLMFPEMDQPNTQPVPDQPFKISVETLNKLSEKTVSKDEGLQILRSDGVSQNDAALLAEDFANPTMRAFLHQRDAVGPEGKSFTEGTEKQSALFIQQSKKRTWTFLFPNLQEKGTAKVSNRDDFRKSVAALLENAGKPE